MAKKENKTNAMRILDKHKIDYKVNNYECDEFVDGMQIADKNGQAYEQSFKTLVTVGKTGGYYVFVLPVDKEIDWRLEHMKDDDGMSWKIESDELIKEI